LPGIEDLCNKRDELQKQILVEEEEKCKIQNDLRILTERLARINESLAKKIASRNEYDKTIAETEAAYMKVMR
jgi:Sjoegren syndrome nuclear autoantigen 1